MSIVPNPTTERNETNPTPPPAPDTAGVPGASPAVQLYEAPQASASVRFPGTAVTIRPGLTGTLNSTSGMAILWWIQDGRYCALQSGGMTAGVRLTGVSAATLLRMAASLRR